MSVEELFPKRKMNLSARGRTAERHYITTWADRFSTSLPQPGAEHPDLASAKVVEHEITETGHNQSGTPSHAIVVVKYSSSAPGLVTITSTAISFHENTPSKDTIEISGGGFTAAGFIAGHIILVSGSASNNGYFTIYSLTDTAMTLIATDDLADEAAGATVTITQQDVVSEDSIEIGVEAAQVPVDNTRKFSTGTIITDDITKLVPRAIYAFSTILDTFPFTTIKAIVGKVNNAAFLGEAAGMWLFLGVSAKSRRNNSGDKIWDVEYRFQYQDIDGAGHGWNWFWDKVTGGYLEITTNPPYESATFDDLQINTTEDL